MNLTPHRHTERGKFVFVGLCLSVACHVFITWSICGFNSVLATDYPSWWTNRNVITNTASTNDWAAANLGQLKWFATNAYDEFEENLPGGTGTNISSMVAGFSLTNNYVVINVGQLKAISAPFWGRLIDEGYTNSYPWTTNSTVDDNDYAIANIGQLKNVFSFDLLLDSDSDGLADWKETGTGIYIGPYNTGSDPNVSDSDSDEIDDGTEVDNRTDPNNSDTNKPVTTITFPTENFTKFVLP